MISLNKQLCITGADIQENENSKSSHTASIIHNNCIFATKLGYGDFKDGWEFPMGTIESSKTA